jgi:hypothetical protein
MRGKQYPGVHGKAVDWVDHVFEDHVLYLHVRFTDKTELCWRIGTSLVIEEADLSDWKTGNFKQLAIFAERERDPAPDQWRQSNIVRACTPAAPGALVLVGGNRRGERYYVLYIRCT